MGASHTKIARPRGNSKELLSPTKLQFMVKNEWWTYPDIPFPIFFIYLFIYLFIFLSFGFSFRSIDVLDCIESRSNIFGFWILLIIPVPLLRVSTSPPPPAPPVGDTGKGFHLDLCCKLSVLNTLKWDLYVLLVRLKSVIYTPTLAKRPRRSSRSSAHRHWRPFS